MKNPISIIGAGIGGLTTALTLKQKGFDVALYEGTAEIKPVGAGIIIANNAMQVFQKLGLQDKIQAAGNKISYMKITDENLKPLSVIDLSVFEQKYGVHNVAIHRGELQKILADAVGFENISLSKKLVDIQKNTDFTLNFDDNSSVQSNILIGADGIKSVVRNKLFQENTIRNAEQICWRGICHFTLPQQYTNELNEAWGKGKRVGFVKISSQKVYWYALANQKDIKNAHDINLSDFFKEFHSDIVSILKATPKEKIIIADILDLKPMQHWQEKNVCLVGDAAHATTPNLGQGACQAIEDAYVLGNCLSQENDINIAFEKYQDIRKKKAHEIVNTSWQLGKLAHINNNFGIWLRNTIMSVIPSSINKKQTEKIFMLS
ncbi:FAD-dependent monooxygenase [Arcicella sp. LKC2W]|uniref:FAD-dependent monooxygenase n=1 Tax=Arcicella sp. LKC2W TaxID=2984198 RepID=UPI002B204EE2|nr:FAD-dependent monooxygenase [Arcicella sp. LKC2W]MEA5458793.1 FAD-dependent monooxygenase [Arcicella sp. LKC2W]